MAKILLVDDDQNVRYAITKLLQRAGHEVVPAGDGKQALALLSNEIQIVVTDIVMPEMEGIELVQALKKLAPDIPVVAISGGGRLGGAGYLDMADALGVSATFAKPLVESAFLKAIAKLAGRHS